MKRIIFLLACLIAAPVAAETQCRQVTVAPNSVTTIQAQINHATRITLPDVITRDIAGNASTDGGQGLWQVTAIGEHYWIKPSDANSSDGESTSLTLLTASGGVFEFVIQRVNNLVSPCIVVRDSIAMGGVFGATAALPAAPAADADAAASPSFTRYRFKGDDVSAVFDDGRYTYVRLSNRPAGLEVPTLRGGDKRHPELIDARYDAETQTYTVTGVHDVLTLVSGRRQVEIRRES